MGLNILSFTILVWLGSVVGGFLGALTGLGGGAIIVPLLTLGFGVDIRYAVGASLVSVIATSSGAAAAYVREGFTNMRIGMFLEIFTTAGALLGAFLAGVMSGSVIVIIFGGECWLPDGEATWIHNIQAFEIAPPKVVTW